jgi:hypothetical protein
VLAYLSRYTHRVAISNRRLIAFDANGVTFLYKDYRRSNPERQQVMTLNTDEFIRRFLLHVLPRGFHRIRHYGLLASATRKANIARARELLPVLPKPEPVEAVELHDQRPPCPCCGGRMRIIETFERWMQPRAPLAHDGAIADHSGARRRLPTARRHQASCNPDQAGTPLGIARPRSTTRRSLNSP